MCRGKARIELQGLRALFNRLVESPRQVKLHHNIMEDGWGNWVEIQGAFRLRQTFLRPSESAEIERIIGMGQGISWIQYHGSLKMLSGSRPIQIVCEARPSERDVGLGEVGVNFQRLHGCSFCFRHHLSRGKHSEKREGVIGVS